MKPSIEKLFDAMRDFQLAIAGAGYQPVAWQTARENLRTKLRSLGIEDAFDWSE